MKNFTIFAAMLLLAGCNTAASQSKQITAACNAKSSTTNICECVGKKSLELTTEERAAVLSMMSSEDGKGVMDLPMSMTIKAGQFIATATTSCAANAL